MKGMGVPVLDWLHAITKGGDKFGTPQTLLSLKLRSRDATKCAVCRTWTEGLAHSSMHPNTSGHEKMFSAIDINIFDPQKVRLLMV